MVFTLARFSEAFLILKAHHGGLPLVLVAMNVVYALDVYRADERRRSAQHEGVRSIGLLGVRLVAPTALRCFQLSTLRRGLRIELVSFVRFSDAFDYPPSPRVDQSRSASVRGQIRRGGTRP